MGQSKPISLGNWANIEELARMSIGTNKGTWAQDPSFGSELWLLAHTGKADAETTGVLERMVREALQWMLEDNLAQSIEVAAERNGKNRIDYRVIITKPDGSQTTIEEVWNAI
jgi:phage gp46-like protein